MTSALSVRTLVQYIDPIKNGLPLIIILAWKICESKEGEPADRFMDSVGELCKEVETVRGFCYLGAKLNASRGCEAAVTARARIGWVKFRKC